VLKEGKSVLEIFENPVVKHVSYWVLSTSSQFSKHLHEYGWGKVWLFVISISLARVNELYRSCQMASALHTSPDSTARAPGMFCMLFLFVCGLEDRCDGNEQIISISQSRCGQRCPTRSLRQRFRVRRGTCILCTSRGKFPSPDCDDRVDKLGAEGDAN
jgi:hypothetical protein